MSEPTDVLLRHWRAVLACLFLAVLAVSAATLTATKQYTSTSSLYFSIRSGSTGTELNQGAMYIQAQMPSYQALAVSDVVVQRAGQALRQQGLAASQISATVPSGTALLAISATRTSPTAAAAAANAVATELRLLASETAPTGAQGKVLLAVEVVRTAAPPHVPSSPRSKRNLLAGVGGGLLLGLGAAYVLETLQRTRRGRRRNDRPKLPDWDMVPDPVETVADRR